MTLTAIGAAVVERDLSRDPCAPCDLRERCPRPLARHVWVCMLCQYCSSSPEGGRRHQRSHPEHAVVMRRR